MVIFSACYLERDDSRNETHHNRSCWQPTFLFRTLGENGRHHEEAHTLLMLIVVCQCRSLPRRSKTQVRCFLLFPKSKFLYWFILYSVYLWKCIYTIFLDFSGFSSTSGTWNIKYMKKPSTYSCSAVWALFPVSLSFLFFSRDVILEI